MEEVLTRHDNLTMDEWIRSEQERTGLPYETLEAIYETEHGLYERMTIDEFFAELDEMLEED
ncbi:MAG: hypothetical protein IJQ56_00155 [Synergistaceae bacterium]|nr:hypothetical protein [Synergistaceae bacterium]MBR0202755.1 hypothetical protein [Synergistaceae bacterium]